MSAVDDGIPEPETRVEVLHACSGDAAYAALAPVQLDVLVMDDDDPAFLEPFGCGAAGGSRAGAWALAFPALAAAWLAPRAGSRRRRRP